MATDARTFSRQQIEAGKFIVHSGAACSCAALAVWLQTSSEGAAATASSLVRRRLVTRSRLLGRVVYVPTPALRALVERWEA